MMLCTLIWLRSTGWQINWAGRVVHSTKQQQQYQFSEEAAVSFVGEIVAASRTNRFQSVPRTRRLTRKHNSIDLDALFSILFLLIVYCKFEHGISQIH